MIRLNKFVSMAVALGFILGIAALALAAGDPNGTWKWEMAGRGGGGGIELVLTLKAEGEKLTGKLELGQFGSSDLKNGVIKGDEFSFETAMEFGGNSIVTKYKGKVEGDTIKGTSERDGAGGRGPAGPQPWEAKRAK